jgi:hypothetical protein
MRLSLHDLAHVEPVEVLARLEDTELEHAGDLTG